MLRLPRAHQSDRAFASHPTTARCRYFDGIDTEPVGLSPSRTTLFKSCAQLFKYRVIDKLPEPQDVPSARGILVHEVLHQLLQLGEMERTFDKAAELLDDVWKVLRADAEFEGFEVDEQAMMLDCIVLLRNYFDVEDPTKVRPHELEWWIEHASDTLALRGIVDRVEIDEDGDWIISDYKTGRPPSLDYSLGAFFGLKFYALVCWRNLGRLPKQLRLIHLQSSGGSRGPEVLTLVPTEQMLLGLERQLEAVADAIRRATISEDWRPRPGRQCEWCPHKPICPAFSARTD
ncbi:MAG: PD-(D/E)XK nuclease family protein [Actinomycetota bacterium]